MSTKLPGCRLAGRGPSLQQLPPSAAPSHSQRLYKHGKGSDCRVCGCRLAEQEGVGTIFCLQEDSDMAYFDLDLQPILDRCQQRGDIKHVRWVPAYRGGNCLRGA